MKKVNFLLLGIPLIVGLTLTGCSEDENEPKDVPSYELELEEDGANDLNQDEEQPDLDDEPSEE
ncbi:hypothetical protein NC661_11770 [Aquibacillus koreensis]|uniref:Lipoprotein n=1 Tax=Aquibacillus koreensis TaxID=279446 RepID=A0A9X4AIJ3_9BACI|nr:hypothetical protein [Aquibacillus koreensis]MCT2535187.1 hypothetical protein [Aquibacillus koreensis]MDC3421046.1 hypothetical protein [Aquibacillus koreensis]